MPKKSWKEKIKTIFPPKSKRPPLLERFVDDEGHPVVLKKVDPKSLTGTAREAFNWFRRKPHSLPRFHRKLPCCSKAGVGFRAGNAFDGSCVIVCHLHNQTWLVKEGEYYTKWDGKMTLPEPGRWHAELTIRVIPASQLRAQRRYRDQLAKDKDDEYERGD